MNILALLLPALLPAGIDIIKSVVSRITGIGQAEPRSTEERISLMQAENDRLRVIADLDRPSGEISKFTANFRALHRYLLGDLILVSTLIYILTPKPDPQTADFLLNLSASVFSFFFGDRVYLAIRRAK